MLNKFVVVATTLSLMSQMALAAPAVAIQDTPELRFLEGAVAMTGMERATAEEVQNNMTALLKEYYSDPAFNSETAMQNLREAALAMDISSVQFEQMIDAAKSSINPSSKQVDSRQLEQALQNLQLKNGAQFAKMSCNAAFGIFMVGLLVAFSACGEVKSWNQLAVGLAGFTIMVAGKLASKNCT